MSKRITRYRKKLFWSSFTGDYAAAVLVAQRGNAYQLKQLGKTLKGLSEEETSIAVDKCLAKIMDRKLPMNTVIEIMTIWFRTDQLPAIPVLMPHFDQFHRKYGARIVNRNS